MVAAGTGITLMPKIAALPTPNLTYVPFRKPDNPSRRIGLAWRQSSPQKILIEAMTKLFKANI
jgi:LysR family hydrogen peroxide-inducible transcriptional activator